MDHAVVRDFAARPLTDFILDAALTVIVDAVAGDYDRATLQVAPEPVPVVMVNPIVGEGWEMRMRVVGVSLTSSYVWSLCTSF